MKTTTTNDALARAIHDLGAVLVRREHDEADLEGRLSKTHPALYAHRDDNTRRWYVVDADEMKHLGSALIEGREDAYSLWCASSDAVEMPSWWSPEKRYAVRDINSGMIMPDAVLRGSPLAYQGVTVSLETGEIVAANLKDVPRSQIYGAEVPA